MKTSRSAMPRSAAIASGTPPGVVTRAEAVECPKCKKRSIVKRSPNLFSCLNCNFQKELPPISPPVSLSTLADPSRLRTSGLQHGLSSSRNASFEDTTESDGLQPLLFAAIAVIFGILLL